MTATILSRRSIGISSAICVSLTLLHSSLALAQDPKPITTRFGQITYNKDGVLVFEGKIIRPQVVYDSTALGWPTAKFQLQSSDVILLQQPAGNSCPGNFVYVVASAHSAVSTKNFGTCYDDNTEPVQEGQTIKFLMPNLNRKGASMFTYKDGIVRKSAASAK